jgi:preprotein translocase subunit SecF
MAINKTLSRTVLTSLTTLLTVIMLLVFGGGAVKDFAMALLIGILVGTYSSIFVATPVMLLWHKNKKIAQ